MSNESEKKRAKLTAGEYFVLMWVIKIIGNIYSNFGTEYIYSQIENEARRNNQEPYPYYSFMKYFHKLIEKEYIAVKYASEVNPGKHTFVLEVLEYK
jgi:hypothetical protein